MALFLKMLAKTFIQENKTLFELFFWDLKFHLQFSHKVFISKGIDYEEPDGSFVFPIVWLTFFLLYSS